MTKIKLAVSSGVATVAGFLGVNLVHAQSVPTMGTSDIAQANGPIWTALIEIIKYYISTYGVLMLWIFGLIAVFILAVLLAKKFLHF